VGGAKQPLSRSAERGADTSPRAKLYFGTADFTLPDRQPLALPPITTTIAIGNHLETKITAFKAHLTQAPLWPQFEQHVRQRGQRELFHLAASITPGPVVEETDLFSGVES
jgi:LmbE family N-acetylglucosaminyl deacetylase